ncbi:MAG: hypothetical protein ACLUEQ_07540 [Cloacibacillus evryensis]
MQTSGKGSSPSSPTAAAVFGTVETIAKLQPRAAVDRNGISISRNDVQDCAPDVSEWLKNLK